MNNLVKKPRSKKAKKAKKTRARQRPPKSVRFSEKEEAELARRAGKLKGRKSVARVIRVALGFDK